MIAARNRHQGGTHKSLGLELSSCQLLACQTGSINVASIDQDGMVLLHRSNLALQLAPAPMGQAWSQRNTYYPLLHIFTRAN